MKGRRVLIIASHMDDEVLGCGGAIARHKAEKDRVWVIFVANRIYCHKFDSERHKTERSHAMAAKAVLKYDRAIFLNLNDERLDGSIQEMISLLEKQVARFRPQVVYVPFRDDNNQDHRAVFDASRVALRPLSTSFIDSIYMYEVPSSTEQSPPLLKSAFLPNFYIDISRYFKPKIKAYQCYRTEKRKYPHPRSEKGLKILAQKRGIEIGFHYAEAFVTLRSKWRQR